MIFLLHAALWCMAAAVPNSRTIAPAASTFPSLFYEFPPPGWVENLAVRPDGNILTVLDTSPVLHQFDPKTSILTFVHDFSHSGNAVGGIVEVSDDLYAVEVLTCDLPNTGTCSNGSSSIWTVDFGIAPTQSVQVKRIAKFPDAGFLNGMAMLNAHTILSADTILGGVWSLDLLTSKTEHLYANHIELYVNGLRVESNCLYFTNVALGTLNRMPVDTNTRASLGAATILASGIEGADDFEIDDLAGFAYVAAGRLNQVRKVDLADGSQEVVANITGPTSIRWAACKGQHHDKIYISSQGGYAQYPGNVSHGGAIYQLDL